MLDIQLTMTVFKILLFKLRREKTFLFKKKWENFFGLGFKTFCGVSFDFFGYWLITASQLKMYQFFEWVMGFCFTFHLSRDTSLNSSKKIVGRQ